MSLRASATGLARRAIPYRAREFFRELRRPSTERSKESSLGVFVLESCASFATEFGGDPTALRQEVLRSALSDRSLLKRSSEAHQFLQTAFQPNYVGDLFEYYQQQQYLLLLNLLSYPFRGAGSLDTQLAPYSVAEKMDGPIDILDYGAGIPYGAIDLARRNPAQIATITLVDLDLVHARIATWILSRLLPGAGRVVSLRTRDPNAVPDLGRTYNFVYGKDIFEHLLDPASHVHNITNHTASKAACLLDIRDHGERYLQHVSPNLTGLGAILEANGFTRLGVIAGQTHFAR